MVSSLTGGPRFGPQPELNVRPRQASLLRAALRWLGMDAASQNYTVLARRFRPQTFDEVVGQQNVAQALKNAITGDRVAHAYLFTGARGVGKTSMARILAKALNCKEAVDGVPCNKCDICEGISSGKDVDVQEIDGASHRRIEDIRAIRSQVNIKSLRTRYKMYIIDEVHMLTNEAFNALLKTLEEPPGGVVFVFCTTEPNKVPDTILSRCQRFDFSTITTQRISERLHDIATAEGYEVDAAALELVARRAAGSMRDSQSLFDQVLAFGSSHITADDVHRLLGTASDDRMVKLVGSILERRQADSLVALDQALQEGVQTGELLDQLLSYFRDLMMLATGAESVGLLSVAESSRADLIPQAKIWGISSLLAALEILSESRMRLRQFVFTRVIIELAIVRLSTLEDLGKIDEIATRLQNAAASEEPSALTTTAPVTQQSPPTSAAPQPQMVSDPPPASGADPGQPAPELAEPQAVEAAPQKKTEDDGESPLETVSSPVEQSQKIVLESGCEEELLQQLVAVNEDVVQRYLRHASSLAISGPNRVVLLFPEEYTFSKTYCERPEVMAGLQRQLGSLTGQNVTLTFAKVESEGGESPDSEKPSGPSSNGQREPDPESDGFLQQAIELFGAKLIKVESGSRARSEG